MKRQFDIITAVFHFQNRRPEAKMLSPEKASLFHQFQRGLLANQSNLYKAFSLADKLAALAWDL